MGVQTTPIIENGPSPALPVPHPTPTRMRNYAHFPPGQQLQTQGAPHKGILQVARYVVSRLSK